MRQVCTEASNESFTGNAGFYEQKTDEEEDKKGGDQLRAYRKSDISYEKKKKVSELQLSYRHLRRSVGVFAPT